MTYLKFFDNIEIFDESIINNIPGEVKKCIEKIDINEISKSEIFKIDPIGYIWELNIDLYKNYIDIDSFKSVGLDIKEILEDIKKHSAFTIYSSIKFKDLQGMSLNECVTKVCKESEPRMDPEDQYNYFKKNHTRFRLDIDNDDSLKQTNFYGCFYESIKKINNTKYEVKFEYPKMLFYILKTWLSCPYSPKNKYGLTFKELSEYIYELISDSKNRKECFIDVYMEAYIFESIFNVSFITKLAELICSKNRDKNLYFSINEINDSFLLSLFQKKITKIEKHILDFISDDSKEKIKNGVLLKGTFVNEINQKILNNGSFFNEEIFNRKKINNLPIIKDLIDKRKKGQINITDTIALNREILLEYFPNHFNRKNQNSNFIAALIGELINLISIPMVLFRDEYILNIYDSIYSNEFHNTNQKGLKLNNVISLINNFLYPMTQASFYYLLHKYVNINNQDCNSENPIKKLLKQYIEDNSSLYLYNDLVATCKRLEKINLSEEVQINITYLAFNYRYESVPFVGKQSFNEFLNYLKFHSSNNYIFSKASYDKFYLNFPFNTIYGSYLKNKQDRKKITKK